MDIRTAIGCFIFFSYICNGNGDVSHLTGFQHSSGGDIPVVNDLDSRSTSQQNWNIRDNIPGEPDVDYPIYSAPPQTAFSCKDKHYGYYADVEARCQVFRVCANTDLTGKGFAFLCPNGTLFNQKFFVCDWYKNVDCSASATFFARNALFGTKMGLMSENDMMSMVQGMVDYTKQPQFNNRPVNNNGGFPFTNSAVPKQLDSQGHGHPNVGPIQSNVINSQLRGGENGNQNQGRSNSNMQVPQRGSEILSQPIFQSENNRFSSTSQTQGVSGSGASGVDSTSSQGSSQSNNAPSTGKSTVGGNNNNGNNDFNSNDNNYQFPQVFVSSLGEISTDPNLRLNPFTTAIVNTRIFDTLSSNVDSVSTSADAGGQFNQLSRNAGRFSISPQSSFGTNQATLQQEINRLSSDQFNYQQSNEQNSISDPRAAGPAPSPQAPSSFGTVKTTQFDDQSRQLNAVYTGSGDLLSQTIGQHGKTGPTAPGELNAIDKNPHLSALVNSLGETILTPVFTGEENLLSQTIEQRGHARPQGSTEGQQLNAKGSSSSTISATQTQYVTSPSKVTAAPSSTTYSSVQNREEKRVNVVFSGEGNLLSQTVTNSQAAQSHPEGTLVYSGEGNLLSQSIGQRAHQADQKQATFPATGGSTFTTNAIGSSGTSQTTRVTAPNSYSANQQSSSTGTTKLVQSSQSNTVSQSLNQQTTQYKQPTTAYTASSTVTTHGSSVTPAAYNNRIQFGEKLTTTSSQTSPTPAPYSPSIPPFKSTTTSIYTPTATSYSQRTQAYNSQSSSSFGQQSFESSFSNNQLPVPSKEYLPSSDNTRTARTNEFSFGNHGAAPLKLTSSQNFARQRFSGQQRDAKQQFTYPADERNRVQPVRDHEAASSNQQNYASTYTSSNSQQYQHAQSSSGAYTQHNTYPQYQQPIHYATIDNRPNPSYSSFQAPPLQSNYPAAIQNNPQTQSSYQSAPNYYIPQSVPSSLPPPVPSSVQSSYPSIPSSLPSIVHPPLQFPSQSTRLAPASPSPKGAQNEKVVVKIIPATGWYLNDANERQSFLDAVSRGLLSEKGFVYVNDVQSGPRQSNTNTQQEAQVAGRSQIDIDEEAYFHGSSSYESPLNSVGKLPGDSDSVSGILETSTPTASRGYHYQHPRRSFSV